MRLADARFWGPKQQCSTLLGMPSSIAGMLASALALSAHAAEVLSIVASKRALYGFALLRDRQGPVGWIQTATRCCLG